MIGDDIILKAFLHGAASCAVFAVLGAVLLQEV